MITFMLVTIFSYSQAQVQSRLTQVAGLNDGETTIQEAGLDYEFDLTSVSDAVLLDVFHAAPQQELNAYPWQILVHRIDLTWHDQLALLIRRTGDGKSVFKQIEGGQAFQYVSNQSRPFFAGKGSFGEIPMQFSVKGLSVILPAQSYRTTIYFTVVAK